MHLHGHKEKTTTENIKKNGMKRFQKVRLRKHYTTI